MSNREQAEKIIRNHVFWALGAGLMPLPLFDIAAVTAIQLDMIRQLSNLYNVDYTKSSGKAFVSALSGSVGARVGASLIKALPGVGTLIGGISMSVLSGASTYAVGQVAVNHFEGEGTLFDLDLDWAKEAYNQAFEQGKEIASELMGKEEEAKDVYKALDKLGQLRDKGVITEQEFEEKKRDLLERI